MRNKRKKNIKRKGVTLIGLLIGIAILSIALSAQIRLLGNTIKRGADLKNLIIATNLAREGIEIAFSWRVTDGWEQIKQLKGQTLCADMRLKRYTSNCTSKWLSPVSYVGYSGEQFSDFEAFLYENPTYNLNVPPFWRTLEIESCDNNPNEDDKCLVISSKVGWGTNRETELTRKIYNWYVP